MCRGPPVIFLTDSELSYHPKDSKGFKALESQTRTRTEFIIKMFLSPHLTGDHRSFKSSPGTVPNTTLSQYCTSAVCLSRSVTQPTYSRENQEAHARRGQPAAHLAGTPRNCHRHQKQGQSESLSEAEKTRRLSVMPSSGGNSGAGKGHQGESKGIRVEYGL